jgi:predicted RNA-binding Zn ribbon-like protein
MVQETEYNRKPATQDLQFIAGNLALDFVNTVGNRLGEPREYLDRVAELERWARLAGLFGTRAHLFLSRKQLEDVHAVREQLYALFQPLASGSAISKQGLSQLNARFSPTASKRKLDYNQNSVNWRWDTSANDPDRILAPILLSATELLVSGRYRRIRQCQGETCGWLFLDRSRAGRRLWCSMADCGNRAKVRRHYRKHRQNSAR